MAARMESNSLDNRIQCSPATEVLIRQAGKGHWLTPRDTLVAAKGKGEIQCYWVMPRSDATSVVSGETSVPEDVESDRIIEDDLQRIFSGDNRVLEISSPHDRYQRLIDWNVELLLGLLKQIAAKRRDMKQLKKVKKAEAPVIKLQSGKSAVDEITEVITLPQVTATIDKSKVTQPSWMIMDENVIAQLRDYVTTIASMYRNNAFHNFEHASHVTMCCSKLLKRVVVRDAVVTDQANAQALHDYTYGITSDPVTQFALVFCALVHDVDHHGVSNFQLISEASPLARLYKNKSIAEQNSVDVAWDLLMDPTYADLQKAIYSDESEMKRFRQLVVNIVLATDIFDKDMTMIRDRRWGRAFQYDEDPKSEEPLPVVDEITENPLARIAGANLKATIVMEHMIQASDVAHTMQHWDIYQKWNERLFTEMHDAFEAGRSTKDPSLSWYEGEIMFFDKYIIPLAKKLADCGVFGVLSDECLNYALQNRKVWAIKGDEIVGEFKARAQQRKKNGGRGCSAVAA